MHSRTAPALVFPATEADRRRHAARTAAWSLTQALQALAARGDQSPEDAQLLAALERWAAGDLT